MTPISTSRPRAISETSTPSILAFGAALVALAMTVRAAASRSARATDNCTPPASVLWAMSRETIFTANGPEASGSAEAAARASATSASRTTGMPNARSAALLSASLRVTGPSGSTRSFGITTGGALRGSRRRRSSAKRASRAAAWARRTGVVSTGMRAASRISAAATDLARRPDQATCTGLSVLAEAAAMASAARCACAPPIEASRIDS